MGVCYLRSSIFHDRSSDLCVYDPMTGERTFLSNPPGTCVGSCNENCKHAYVLLTATDGIGCSFMLTAADPLADTGSNMEFQSASSDSGGTWRSVTRVGDPSFHWRWLKHGSRDYIVVLVGGFINWMFFHGDEIVTCDDGTGKPGLLNVPVTSFYRAGRLHLSPPADGRELRLLTADGPVISVWRLQHFSASGACWALEAAINMEEKLRSLATEISPSSVQIRFEYSGEMSGVALLRVGGRDGPLFILDLKTMEIRRPRLDSPYSPVLLEINLLARLQAMKIYS